MEPIPKAIFMPFLPLLSAVYTHFKFFFKTQNEICVSEFESKTV